MLKSLFLASLLLVPFAARAQADSDKPIPTTNTTAKTAEQMHVDDCAKARKANRTCVLDMTGEKVPGSVPGGDGITTTGIKFDPHKSLIRLRHDFIPEIIKSAEDL